jgi:UDP-glucose 4-epimerase
MKQEIKMKKILVVGGAGYIGSHMVVKLLEAGYLPVTLDNLSCGHDDAVKGGEFILGDLADKKFLDEVLGGHKFTAVMHFASFIQVGESVVEPAKYYENNVVNTLNLLNAMHKHQINNFIFSSSAAIFGEPEYIPIDEKHPQHPVSPYGHSKAMVEQILRDYDRAYGLRSICLRYFNAAGAHPDGILGERHDPESHLIPLVLQVAAGKRENIAIYGDDYAAPDGTCVRDYIHICDLCDAHLAALNYLWKNNKSACFNLGNGEGYSVKQVIDACRQVTGCDIPVEVKDRRFGDSAVLVADSKLAKKTLKWEPKFCQLETIIEHAWNWMNSRFAN